ncbi:MAG: response regulator [Planctomycetaceae bacterium]|nr:response regulator [Planctomycetaceae bacterium]
MDATLLIGDGDRRRQDALRRYFWESGFLVATAVDARECLNKLLAIEPDVVLIALEMPGGADAVIARLNQGLIPEKRPIVLVLGDAPPKTISDRTRVPICNCFEWPVPAEELLDRAGMEIARKLLRFAEESESRRYAAGSLV